MYGKYGKAVERKGKQLDEDGAPMYGFATPKKNSMIDRMTPKKTPVSKAMENVTPTRKRSAPTTPTSSRKSKAAVNTPLSKLKLRADANAPETPKSVRKRISKKIEQKLESSSSEEEDDDDSDEEHDSDVDAKDPDNLKKSEIVNADTDDFFEKQGSKEITTSDKTLSQLKTPRLSPEVLRNILQHEPLKYADEIERLTLNYRRMFHKWLHLLGEGFNVLLYGFGSKRDLLNELHTSMLDGKDCVVINGFFPSLTDPSPVQATVW